MDPNLGAWLKAQLLVLAPNGLLAYGPALQVHKQLLLSGPLPGLCPLPPYRLLLFSLDAKSLGFALNGLLGAFLSLHQDGDLFVGPKITPLGGGFEYVRIEDEGAASPPLPLYKELVQSVVPASHVLEGLRGCHRKECSECSVLDERGDLRLEYVTGVPFLLAREESVHLCPYWFRLLKGRS